MGVLFGGRSGEHAVSLLSARSVLAALDPARFEAVPLGIDRQGHWLLPDDAQRALESGPDAVPGRAVTLRPGPGGALVTADGARSPAVDVVFPVLHGPNGEDGTIQGLLQLCGLPYVGTGVLGSAVGMDKIMQKDVFVRHGLPTPDYVGVSRVDWRADPGGVAARVGTAVGLPCFVKPANLGSSVGISRAADAAELRAALALAARHDRRLICERAVTGCREVECGVLGNDHPRVSVPGEVVPHAVFYDYDSKYTAGGADLVIPADLPPAVTARIQTLALRAFAALDCAGMARVDFFVRTAPDAVLVNEVNTIPGFTERSMYPRLWAASGLPYPELLAQLVYLALERHADGAAGEEERP